MAEACKWPAALGQAPLSLHDELSECRSWVGALALLEQMRQSGVTPRHQGLNEAIRACGRAGKWRESLALLEAMPGLRIVPDAAIFTNVGRSCSQAGQWARATAIWDEMQQSGMQVAHGFRDAISACERGKQWSYALLLLDTLRNTGRPPTAEHFRAALAACERSWQHCLQLWQEMRAAGVEPEVGHFSSVLLAAENGKRWEFALSVLAEMLELAEPEPYHFERVISCCEKNQQWECALQLLHHMLTVGPPPDCGCFTATITACAKGRTDTSHWNYSLWLLERMMLPEIGVTERVGVVPSPGTFGEVMSACQKGRQWEQCLALLGTMREIGLVPTNTCTHSAIRACERSAKWECALALLEQHRHLRLRSDVVDTGAEVLIASSALGACDKAGQLHRLPVSIFRELGADAEDVFARSLAQLDSNQAQGRFRRKEGIFMIGYAHVAFTRLRALDLQPSRPLMRWRRHVQRMVECKLRSLHPPWPVLPPPGITEDWLRCMNDLAHLFTADVLKRFGLWNFPLGDAAALRRHVWWELERQPPDPEGYFVAAIVRYDVVVGSGRLRSPGKVVVYSLAEPCPGALAPVQMLGDRILHRGWHAERRALLGVAMRILLRSGSKRLCPQGTVHLHVNHTPCLSCMATISQFQGRFPSLNLSVTFDVWWELPAVLLDPWDRRWPQWRPCSHDALGASELGIRLGAS